MTTTQNPTSAATGVLICAEHGISYRQGCIHCENDLADMEASQPAASGPGEDFVAFIGGVAITGEMIRQALAAQPAPGVGGVSELLEQLRSELAADKGWDYTEYEKSRLAEKERVISQLEALTAKPGAEGSALAPGCGDGVG